MQRLFSIILISCAILGLFGMASISEASPTSPREPCVFDDADNAVNPPCLDGEVQLGNPDIYVLLAPLPCDSSSPGCENLIPPSQSH